MCRAFSFEEHGRRDDQLLDHQSALAGWGIRQGSAPDGTAHASMRPLDDPTKVPPVLDVNLAIGIAAARL
jgi:hypothetical protein